MKPSRIRSIIEALRLIAGVRQALINRSAAVAAMAVRRSA